MSQKKESKKFAQTPIKIESWEREKISRLGARRTSITIALRALTEALDEIVFEGWNFWDEIFKKYNIDPSKDYYEYDSEILERKRFP